MSLILSKKSRYNKVDLLKMVIKNVFSIETDFHPIIIEFKSVHSLYVEIIYSLIDKVRLTEIIRYKYFQAISDERFL